MDDFEVVRQAFEWLGAGSHAPARAALDRIQAERDRLREDVAHLLDGIDFTPTRIMDEGDADRLNDFIEQIGAMLKQRLRRALATLYRYRVQMVATVEAHDAEQAAAIASERHGPWVRVMKVERGPRARRALEGREP